MSDNYQAVYDAVRSRIGHTDVGQVIQDVLRQNFDVSYLLPSVFQDVAASFGDAAAEHRRPSAVFRPAIGRDGDQWFALYGPDLQVGVAGFGDSPEAAMQAFDKAWTQTITAEQSKKEPGS